MMTDSNLSMRASQGGEITPGGQERIVGKRSIKMRSVSWIRRAEIRFAVRPLSQEHEYVARLRTLVDFLRSVFGLFD